MQYLGMLGFFFALIAWSETIALKKRVAALEAAGAGKTSQ